MSRDEENGEELVVGGIIASDGKPCFKIVFPNQELAWKYKEMFVWILKDDKYKVKVNHAYFDKKNEG